MHTNTMVESSTLLNLPKLCDLALNTPEVGVVNFTVLHSLLQVMIKQLNLSDTFVEFRGLESERVQHFITASTPGNDLTLTEYTIGGAELDEGHERDDQDHIQTKTKKISIEKGSEDESQKEKPTESNKQPEKSRVQTKQDTPQNKKKAVSPKKEQSLVLSDGKDKSTVILVEGSRDQMSSGTQFTVAVSKDHFEELQQKIQEIENRMRELEGLPANEKLMSALSEGGDKTPVLDMYQILSLQKRMDAVDEGMEKLATMVETVARGSIVEFDPDTSRHQSVRSGEFPKKTLKERVEDIENSLNIEHVPRPSVPTAVAPEPHVVGPTMQYVAEDIERFDISTKPVVDALTILKLSVLDLKGRLSELPQMTKAVAELQNMLSASPESQPTEVQIKLLESKFDDFAEQIHSLDGGFSRQVNILQSRISDMEKQVGEMLEKVHLMPEDAPTGESGHITSDLHNQLTTLQDDFNVVSETVQKLSEDHATKEHTMDILVEQIELLKTVKADREDLEDALADKADACQINRKVSFEQFDQACGDMSKSIEEALAKLSQQELLWNQALDNLQNSIGGKLDKIELNPLRDFINNKLKALQEKFKTLNAMKRENEAAGTKSKYLKNVNCISCDKDVVMRREMDPSLYPKPYAVPPSRSMGPYLAYELDQLRKQQKCVPSSKNMNNFENALQTSRSARSPDHVCNRYCGGSHTVTTPQQRVTRLGHFLEQWGPEIAPVDDTLVRGTDGRMPFTEFEYDDFPFPNMYKARDDQQLRQLASERPATAHPESKPAMYITPENTARKLTKDEMTTTRTSNQQGQGKKSGSLINTPPVPKTTESASQENKQE